MKVTNTSSCLDVLSSSRASHACMRPRRDNATTRSDIPPMIHAPSFLRLFSTFQQPLSTCLLPSRKQLTFSLCAYQPGKTAFAGLCPLTRFVQENRPQVPLLATTASLIEVLVLQKGGLFSSLSLHGAMHWHIRRKTCLYNVSLFVIGAYRGWST